MANTDDNKERELVTEILKSKNEQKVIKTTLSTDQRIIARVTDGIYRQPGSALRELIANAYDADATRVVIKTDVPRFERISIEDNGLGMSPETLAHMLLHIGGSAKRHEEGVKLKITDAKDSTCSPGGRKLIGKIGIGIFSVAQLTHNFQIITKTKGDNFRTIATIALKQYSDEDFDQENEQETYETGQVNIWREKAKDITSQGTTIILTNIRPQARDTLRSREIWVTIEQNENAAPEDEKQSILPPKFHVGRVDQTGEILEKTGNKFINVPWSSTDNSQQAFEKLVQSVWLETQFSNPNPQLSKIFDYYLQMVWQLSLSIPLSYVDGHLFDINLTDWCEAFLLSNTPKGSASKIPSKKSSARKILDLKDGNDQLNFEVFFDDLKLYRPIKFKGLPTTNHAIKHPLIFFGKCREDFSQYAKELSGGTLEFEAYLFWNPKICPTEHQGSLIRIHGASGTLFDSSFMRYQVSEQTRLRQITCEIFIKQGFDSALNIDRESFNYAYPHAAFLTRWLHSSLRQLATAQKKVAADIRDKTRTDLKTQQLSDIQKIALETWQKETRDEDSLPPKILIEEQSSLDSEKYEDAIVLNRYSLTTKTQTSKNHSNIIDEKFKAIIQILASYELLDKLSRTKQNNLYKAIYKILELSE